MILLCFNLHYKGRAEKAGFRSPMLTKQNFKKDVLQVDPAIQIKVNTVPRADVSGV